MGLQGPASRWQGRRCWTLVPLSSTLTLTFALALSCSPVPISAPFFFPLTLHHLKNDIVISLFLYLQPVSLLQREKVNSRNRTEACALTGAPPDQHVWQIHVRLGDETGNGR